MGNGNGFYFLIRYVNKGKKRDFFVMKKCFLFFFWMTVLFCFTACQFAGGGGKAESYKSKVEAPSRENAKPPSSKPMEQEESQENKPASLVDSAVQSPLPQGFVDVKQAVPGVLVEARYATTYNFVGEPIRGYCGNTLWLTREAAQALYFANEKAMEQGYCLKVLDGYRPQRAVDHFVAWAKDVTDTKMKQEFYPNVEKSNLFQEGYIATRSGHSRGSTVDVTLVQLASGQEVDMGSPFDYFDPISHALRTQGLTEEQIKNRGLLREWMTQAGFRPLSTEWWHFTLEDEPFPNTYFDVPMGAE